MSIEEIIRAWKAEDDEEKHENAPANPAGDELSDEELEDVEGGLESTSCGDTSTNSCNTGLSDSI